MLLLSFFLDHLNFVLLRFIECELHICYDGAHDLEVLKQRVLLLQHVLLFAHPLSEFVSLVEFVDNCRDVDPWFVLIQQVLDEVRKLVLLPDNGHGNAIFNLHFEVSSVLFFRHVRDFSFAKLDRVSLHEALFQLLDMLHFVFLGVFHGQHDVLYQATRVSRKVLLKVILLQVGR